MGMAEASFRQLAAFVAVAREESFSAAADELRYGQATVSQQVAALEKHIGARLFERPGGPKPISLTPLGRVLLPQAQHILEHLTNAELDIRDVASGAAGRIKIGTFQSVAVHLLPVAVHALRMKSPHVTFSLFEGPSSEGLIDLLLEAEADVTAYAGFPHPHWKKIWSTNPLERLMREIKRRADVVGIFPDDASIIRLVGSVLSEQHDEWHVSDRRYLGEESMALIATMHQHQIGKEVNQHQLPAAG